MDATPLQEYSPFIVVVYFIFIQTFCFQDKTGIQDHSLLIRKPQQHIVKYPVKLGDEAILTPMSLFHPEMLGIMGPHLVRTQGRFIGDPEDPHDEFYLQMTSREVSQQQNI
jgi:actin-related protein 8